MNFHTILDISGPYMLVEQEELSYNELARIVARELYKIHLIDNLEIENDRQIIAHSFFEISKDNDLTADKFEETMELLYNWGEQMFNNKRVCWIKTVV